MARYSFALAAAVGLVVSALLGLVIIPLLRKLHFGKTIKEIGPTWHKEKQGTPTMGGFLFIIGSIAGLGCGYGVLITALPEFAGPTYLADNLVLLISVLTALCFAAVGFIDDYIGLKNKRNLGLLARYKIIMQVLITTCYLISLHYAGALSTGIFLPIAGYVDFGIWYYILSFVLIIGIVNGANLTDGVDGLDGSVTFVVSLGFMMVASALGYYNMGLYAAALAGACVGYLVWNFHPAKVFMGDVGSMYLGGAVVTFAYGMGRPELLFLLGIVYVLEALSVVIQVTYFKTTHGKRIFKMSPIHHHFEMSGWGENKIVWVFSGVAFIGVLLALAYVAIT
ncbi:phospho-N-acetylmuramoyl-pentapeptide-transferase [Ruminococcaceae bacterium OttesenSCG-928-N02]|nr:phospho-N-acetylmuramoyl-pentapeptide-transferase [Ruminococcaceae bacterium OttesenSCG-928-N02]